MSRETLSSQYSVQKLHLLAAGTNRQKKPGNQHTKMASSIHTLSHLFSTQIVKNNQSFLFFPPNPRISFKNPTNFNLQLNNKVPVILSFKGSSCFRAKASMADVASQKNLNVFDSEEALAVSLAKYVAELSDKFVKERGAFTVVVSGGSLITSLRKLLEPPYVNSIDWSKWHVFWVDERVVPKDHPDSNYKLAYDSFLSKVPILPEHIHAINDTLTAEGAAEDYETRLRELVKTNVIATSTTTGFPKFDLQLLGMGPDGHVASLFPGHPLVKENKKWVTFIKDSPKPPLERITFTFPIINSSAYVVLVICGAGKAAVVKAALSDNQSSEQLPVQMVSAQQELNWFLDKEAAAML